MAGITLLLKFSGRGKCGRDDPFIKEIPGLGEYDRDNPIVKTIQVLENVAEIILLYI